MSGVVLRGPSDPEGTFLRRGDPLQALAVQAPTTVRGFRDGDSRGRPSPRSTTRAAGRATPSMSARWCATRLATSPRSAKQPGVRRVDESGGTLRFDAQLPIGKSLLSLRASLEAKSSAGGDPVVRTIPFRSAEDTLSSRPAMVQWVDWHLHEAIPAVLLAAIAMPADARTCAGPPPNTASPAGTDPTFPGRRSARFKSMPSSQSETAAFPVREKN
jgi:hypothetical protein